MSSYERKRYKQYKSIRTIQRIAAKKRKIETEEQSKQPSEQQIEHPSEQQSEHPSEHPSEQPSDQPSEQCNLFNEINDLLHDEQATKQDLAAAFLASFFSNSNTQKSLTDYLDLVNQLLLVKENRLPTSFSGLVSLLNGKQRKSFKAKSWYCSSCQKLFIEKQINRFQRNCQIELVNKTNNASSICNTRQFMILFLAKLYKISNTLIFI